MKFKEIILPSNEKIKKGEIIYAYQNNKYKYGRFYGWDWGFPIVERKNRNKIIWVGLICIDKIYVKI